MKRIAIVIALALLLALAVAAPALAAAPRDWQAHKAPSPGEAYVFPMSEFFGGTTLWWEVDAQNNEIDHDAALEPIPANYPIFICFGWASPIRGTVVGIPKSDFYALTLNDARGTNVWSLTATEAKAKWSVVYDSGFPGPAFNKAMTTYWARDWYVPVDLPAGSYTGTTTETVRRMITDSSFDSSLLPPDPDAEWTRHLQQRPFKVWPGQYDYTFWFTIAP